MSDESGFRAAMLESPEDDSLRMVFADWLEERGDDRAELIRLLHGLTQSIDVPERKEKEERLRSLVASGVKPIGPFWTTSIGMKFAWIPAGTFLMGSPEGEPGRWDEETQHIVTLTRGFYLGVHQVTQTQWLAMMDNNPSHFRSDENLPVENVSWEDCQEFLRRLSADEEREYCLPTESQWEFACRAGTTTPFYFGETLSTDQANVNVGGKGKEGACRDRSAPVGAFPPNAWGLHDMHGNVWEWCADWHGDYPEGEVAAPEGPPSGERRVLRGGAFGLHPVLARSAFRLRLVPSNRSEIAGFRAVCTGPHR